MKTLKTFSMAMVALMFAVFAAGCGSQPLTPREGTTLGGGVVGAGAGALLGSVLPPAGPIIGAGIGGGIGLAAGAALGNEIEIVQADNQQTQTQLEQQQKDMEQQRREMQQLKDQEERDEGLQSQTRTRTYERSTTVTP